MKLGRLAPIAGRYAGMLDVCGEPGGAEVRADFESRTAPMSASNRNSPRGPWYGFNHTYNRAQQDGPYSAQRCASNIEYSKEAYESTLNRFSATN